MLFLLYVYVRAFHCRELHERDHHLREALLPRAPPLFIVARGFFTVSLGDTLVPLCLRKQHYCIPSSTLPSLAMDEQNTRHGKFSCRVMRQVERQRRRPRR
jgi:hypothetical protein